MSTCAASISASSLPSEPPLQRRMRPNAEGALTSKMRTSFMGTVSRRRNGPPWTGFNALPTSGRGRPLRGRLPIA